MSNRRKCGTKIDTSNATTLSWEDERCYGYIVPEAPWEKEKTNKLFGEQR